MSRHRLHNSAWLMPGRLREFRKIIRLIGNRGRSAIIRSNARTLLINGLLIEDRVDHLARLHEDPDYGCHHAARLIHKPVAVRDVESQRAARDRDSSSPFFQFPPGWI